MACRLDQPIGLPADGNQEMVTTAVSDLPRNGWFCEYNTEDGLRKSNIESGCISNTRQDRYC